MQLDAPVATQLAAQALQRRDDHAAHRAQVEVMR